MANEKMRGVIFTGDRKVSVREFQKPEPGIGEVLVKMKAAGLCGSDLHRYREPASMRKGNEIIQGHEPSGIVEAVGDGVQNIREGDRVSLYHYRGCGHCKHCLAGNIMWCDDRRGYGWHIHGSSADYILTDEINCQVLPPSFSYALGTLIACTAGTAYSAMRRLQVSGENTVAIFGLGPVGLSGLMIAKAMGGQIIGIDPILERRNIALELGADSVIDPTELDTVKAIRELNGGEGVDRSFETSGTNSGRQSAANCLRIEGTGVFVGLGSNTTTFDMRDVIVNQYSILGSYVIPRYMYWDLAKFILRHQLPFDKLITHRFPLAEADEALKVFDEGSTGKVIFEWD